MHRQPAIFFDRDGTLIVEKNFLSDPDEVAFEVGVVEALRRLKAAGFVFVVITNQSGIGRGIIAESEFLATQCRLTDLLDAADVPLLDYYFCPHHPTEATGPYLQTCECRKPAPGMIAKALSDHPIDSAKSFMIGDRLRDVQAGQNAGLRTILVMTGYGREQQTEMGEVVPDFVARDLVDAASFILDSPE